MTNMRATERLLEVIGEMTHEIRRGFNWDNLPPAIATGFGEPLARIEVAISELRRRGDTLVRADDLREVLEYVRAREPISEGYLGEGDDDHVRFIAGQDRLENALGGKLR